jgi:hypothetical protein
MNHNDGAIAPFDAKLLLSRSLRDAVLSSSAIPLPLDAAPALVFRVPRAANVVPHYVLRGPRKANLRHPRARGGQS